MCSSFIECTQTNHVVFESVRLRFALSAIAYGGEISMIELAMLSVEMLLFTFCDTLYVGLQQRGAGWLFCLFEEPTD